MAIRKTKTTIFRQLISNVIVPSVLALLLLSVLNFNNTKDIIVRATEERNYIIADEVYRILELQDVTLNLIGKAMDKRMAEFSNQLVDYLSKVDNPAKVDLDNLRTQLGMNPIMEDIYLIDAEGIVVNTTFKRDLMLDFFSFGEDHKEMLLNVLETGEFKSEQLFIEANTKRLKKYCYAATKDKKYIIELGFYSSEADEIIDFIKNTSADIENKYQSIFDVELFIGSKVPISFNTNALVVEGQDEVLNRAFTQRDTVTILEKNKGIRTGYQYIYMERKNTELYQNSVIRIIYDQTSDYKKLRAELIKFLVIAFIGLILVVVLTYSKTKVITDPIKRLVDKVNRISDGHLDERADVKGDNEIATLSMHFNSMIDELESYYNELEQKVEERTREIQQQKEEIEAQRDSIEDQKNQLEEKNDSLENAFFEIKVQKQHITDSIVYAKRIQNAILPPSIVIDKVVPQNFIFYKPKDIVSGDFYYVETIAGLSVIAAVDCTGHGVPGAFMSIIGNNQLNNAIKAKKTKNADAILNLLNEGVANDLRQEIGQNSVKDGMDIALCVIDYKNNKLEFAGAYNPLYLIRDGELIQFKADKFAIGSHIDYPDRVYTRHEIDLKEGDLIYIFSDGYADQFGGPRNRKFMYKNFRQLLVDISMEPLAVQKQILEKKHDEWKLDYEQVDDIIILGIKI